MAAMTTRLAFVAAVLANVLPGDKVAITLATGPRTMDLGRGPQVILAGQTVTFTIRETVEVEGL